MERGTESFPIQPPGNVYSRFNISIHGIDPSTTRDSPAFGGLWAILEERTGVRPVVAHNASFDVSVLRGELDPLGRRYPIWSTTARWSSRVPAGRGCTATGCSTRRRTAGSPFSVTTPAGRCLPAVGFGAVISVGCRECHSSRAWPVALRS